MGLFKCSKCECIENTALGLYWMSKESHHFYWDSENIIYKGLPLCSECAPKKFSDGTSTKYGQWHNRFTKEYISTVPENERKNIYNL